MVEYLMAFFIFTIEGILGRERYDVRSFPASEKERAQQWANEWIEAKPHRRIWKIIEGAEYVANPQTIDIQKEREVRWLTE